MTKLAKDTVGKPTRDPVAWDELVGRIKRLEGRVNGIQEGMDGHAKDIYGEDGIMDRVDRCEARLDGRGQEVERDLTPPEALDALREAVGPHVGEEPEAYAGQADQERKEPRIEGEAEGLEVVAHQIFDGGHHYYSDGPDYDGRSTPLVRKADAERGIARLRARLGDAEGSEKVRADCLRGRVDEAERERDEARAALRKETTDDQ
jgi:hypothetical protein